MRNQEGYNDQPGFPEGVSDQPEPELVFPASTSKTDIKLRQAAKKRMRRALQGPLFDPSSTDLHVFHPSFDVQACVEKGFQKVQKQVFAEQRFQKVVKLKDAIHGEVYLVTKRQDGQAGQSRHGPPKRSVMKKMENWRVELARAFEANDRTAFFAEREPHEDALTEIGVLQRLSQLPDVCRFLLKFTGSFRNATHTMLVTEYCDGGDLMTVLLEKRKSAFGEVQVRSFMWQLFQAVTCLHNHNIDHRDISLENILIKDEELRLMDFGQAVQIHQPQAQERLFRYFRPCGKLPYAAPECWVPLARTTLPCPLGYIAGTPFMVRLPPMTGQYGFFTEMAFLPGFVRGQPSICEPYGYEIPPIDLFACGVVFFILLSRQAPWAVARFGDRAFGMAVFGERPSRASLMQLWGSVPLSAYAEVLLDWLTNPFPTARPSIRQCLDHPWFAEQ